MPFDSSAFLMHVTRRPGVYRMFDAMGEVIYVGKAKNLKNRLSSYFRVSSLSVKTRALVAQIDNIEVTVTRTEAEALILESNLIKQLRPKYNVLLKDDKSYPLIRISPSEFPRVSFFRGARTRRDAEYFGPYPNSLAVRETVNLLQKIFLIRQCEDSFFNNRSRPCLQYQIKRCSAPCVDLISQEDYAADLENARLFLRGKSQPVIENLIQRMDKASKSLDFESAARLRDQIQIVQKVAEEQHVTAGKGDLDVLALESESNMMCIQLHMVRGGQNLGGRAYYPKVPRDTEEAEVLSAFIAQYYLKNEPPSEIVIDRVLEDKSVLADALSMHANHKVGIIHQPKLDKAKWLQSARLNASNALKTKLVSKETVGIRLNALMELLELDAVPKKMECFDISHTQGERTVASCVVFDMNGARKDLYRKFNIEGITPGDDYAAMNQALKRRYSRMKADNAELPDVLLIDGGKGQLSEAMAIMQELDLDDILVVGVAKGAARKVGEETIIIPVQAREFKVNATHAGLHLIQQIRDEAHRFAITGHRERRAKARNESPLEQIAGVGNKRRQQLLKHFGGIQGIMRASVEDLSKVPNISHALAQTIYEHFNNP